MSFAPRFLTFPIFISLLFAVACVGSKSVNGNGRNAANTAVSASPSTAVVAKDDIEELEALINLPFHPDEALWREDSVPGNEKMRKLSAVLKFTKAESSKISEIIAKSESPAPFEIEAESWFPPELVAKTQESGNGTIKGKSFPATDFARAPFADGRISRIDGTDFYILELYAR